MERSDRAAEEGSVDRQTERQELPRSFPRERKLAAPAERMRHCQPELGEAKRQQVHQQNEPVCSVLHLGNEEVSLCVCVCVCETKHSTQFEYLHNGGTRV